jgi:hypothetical protein
MTHGRSAKGKRGECGPRCDTEVVKAGRHPATVGFHAARGFPHSKGALPVGDALRVPSGTHDALRHPHRNVDDACAVASILCQNNLSEAWVYSFSYNWERG